MSIINKLKAELSQKDKRLSNKELENEHWLNEIQKLEDIIRDQNKIIDRQYNDKLELEQHYNSILESLSFKFGFKFTYLFRLIIDKLKRRETVLIPQSISNNLLFRPNPIDYKVQPFLHSNKRPNKIDKTILLSKFVFDSKYYRERNKDLAGKDNKTVTQHWITNGYKEERASSPVFNILHYTEKNRDVIQTLGNDPLTVINHFVLHGIREGRDSSTDYNVTAYIELNPDVKNNFGLGYYEATNHFIDYGYKENRKANSPTYSSSIKNNLKSQRDILTRKFRPYQQNKKVSIVMPTWDRETVIRNAIDSVIDQSYENWELIISDDGSTDNTEQLINSLYGNFITEGKIIYLKNKHQGVSPTRNAALEVASGDYIAFLDSDNKWYPSFLLIMVNSIEENKNANIAYCGMRIFDFVHHETRVLINEFDRENLKELNYIDLNTIVFHKNLYLKYGGFDEYLTRLVDWDFILRYVQKEDPLSIGTTLLDYFIKKNLNNITSTQPLAPNFTKIRDKPYATLNKLYKKGNYINEVQDKLSESKKNLKVGYIVWQFPVLSETFIANEIRWLVNNNIDVIVYHWEVPKNKATLDFKVKSFQSNDLNILIAKIKEDNRTILHTHFIFPSTTNLLWPIADQLKIPFTTIGHGVDVFHVDNKKRFKLDLISKSPYNLRLFYPGTYHRFHFLLHKAQENNLMNLAQSFDYNHFYRNVNLYKKSPKKKICTIVRYVEKKGIEYLIEAGKFLEDVEINIYGFGDLEKSYKKLIKKHKLQNVHLKGSIDGRDKLREVLFDHDAFVLPCVIAKNGDMEGIPTILMEAMAAGVPVITSNISSIPDLVIDSFTGFIAKQKDAESLAEKIKEFYSYDKDSTKQILLNAQKHVEKKFDINHQMSKMVKIWKGTTIDIFLVSYNNVNELKEVIRRIYKYTSIDFNLFIIDNNSNSETKKFLTNLVDRTHNCKVTFLEENVYCGPASNIAIEQGESDFCIYLCSKEGFILNFNWEWDLIQYMEKNPKVGLAGHLSFSPSFATGDQLSNHPMFPKFRAKEHALQNLSLDIQHVQGGVYILRRKMYDEIGGFNPQTPHDMMDVEYSYYVESTGWQLGHVPNLYSLTVLTQPNLDALIDEHTTVAHPQTLESVKRFDRIVNNSVFKCNICFHTETRSNEKHLYCSKCNSNTIDRSIYRYLAESNIIYRKKNCLVIAKNSILSEKLSKMFSLTESKNYLEEFLEINWDIIILFDQQNAHKFIKKNNFEILITPETFSEDTVPDKRYSLNSVYYHSNTMKFENKPFQEIRKQQ